MLEKESGKICENEYKMEHVRTKKIYQHLQLRRNQLEPLALKKQYSHVIHTTRKKIATEESSVCNLALFIIYLAQK